MKSGLYRGYSSYEYQAKHSFTITDVECVKLDLLNHIFTRKGDRVAMPNFGTRIPDIVFEPLDSVTISIIEEDLNAVFAFDPRVDLINLVITPLYDYNAVIASAELVYVELNMTGTLDINIQFENSAQ